MGIFSEPSETAMPFGDLTEQIVDTDQEGVIAYAAGVNAENIVEALLLDTSTIYSVSWEIPNVQGGTDWRFDQGAANRLYIDTLKMLEDKPGALVRMFKIDAHELITCAIDGEIWGMTSELSPEDLPDGYEYLAGQRVGPVA